MRGQGPLTGPQENIHLKQPLLGGDIAPPGGGVHITAGSDQGDAVPINGDGRAQLHRTIERDDSAGPGGLAGPVRQEIRSCNGQDQCQQESDAEREAKDSSPGEVHTRCLSLRNMSSHRGDTYNLAASPVMDDTRTVVSAWVDLNQPAGSCSRSTAPRCQFLLPRYSV